jgi:hypothetical protein
VSRARTVVQAALKGVVEAEALMADGEKHSSLTLRRALHRPVVAEMIAQREKNICGQWWREAGG